MFVQAKSVSMGMSVCLHQPNLLSVHVMEAILEVQTRGAPRAVCVFVHVRPRVVTGVFMCVSAIYRLSYLCVCVLCICMLTPLNDCDYIMQLS